VNRMFDGPNNNNILLYYFLHPYASKHNNYNVILLSPTNSYYKFRQRRIEMKYSDSVCVFVTPRDSRESQAIIDIPRDSWNHGFIQSSIVGCNKNSCKIVIRIIGNDI